MFGIIAEQSIGKLFTAAIIPAITQALAYMLVIWILCRLRPQDGPAMERATGRSVVPRCGGSST